MRETGVETPLDFRPGRVPRPALWLGLGGLIPFAALAAAAHLAPSPWDFRALAFQAGYGASILSFMGGCRWGFAAAEVDEEGASWWRMGVAVAPALLAWVSLMASPAAGALVCALGLLALFAADVSLTRAGGAPTWWPALRLPLTVGAVLGLLVGAAAGDDVFSASALLDSGLAAL
ncbi:MAG: DUF3429 domain-containing protein [Pseudomonadota bacterium]